MKKLAVIAGLVLVLFLMKTSFWSSKCREPVLIEFLHPQLPAPPEGPFTVVTMNMAGSSDMEEILDDFQRLQLF
jgi:hypothetical protein